jgi:hypothetical protein
MAEHPLVASPVESQASLPLEYGRPRRVRTRWVRLSLFVVIGLLIAAMMPRMWTEFGYRVGRRNFQREMLTFTAPPGTLAYGEGDDAQSIAAGAAPSWIDASPAFQPFQRIRSGRARQAPTWQTWFSLPDYSIDEETTLFLHERVSPGGKRRLVGVSLSTFPSPWATTSATEQFAFRLAVSTPATMITPSSTPPAASSMWQRMGHWPPPDVPVRFELGQPHPSDRSRFTIGYAIGGHPGTIEGRLNDDDTLTLVVADGPLLNPPPTKRRDRRLSPP